MTGKPFLILAASVLAFCLGEPICSPSNMCRDLWTAKKCNAVKHCIAEDWSRLKPTGNRDNVCDICLKMVKEARDTLMSNETREELKEVFEGSCSLLVLKPAVELCDRLVDELVPELVDVLSSQMDPEAVCSVAKLCNNEAFRVAQKNSKECIHCEAFIQASGELMQSVTADDFKNEMLDVCRSAGTFSDACSHLGIKHADFLYNLSKSVLKKNPCEATLVCPLTPGGPAAVSHPQALTKKKMCPLCKTVMASVRKQLLRAKTAESFAENMYRTCDELDISNSTCSQMSSPEFYEKLKGSETLPNLLCHVAFCKEKTKEDVPVWPLVSTTGDRLDTDFVDFLSFSDALLPQKQQETQPTVRPTIAYGDRIENPVFLGPVMPPKVYGGNTEECDTCNEVLEILAEPVRNDDDYLNKMFDIVCIGVKNPDSCKRFIDKYSPILTRAFAEGGVSKEMCTNLVPYCQVKRREPTQSGSCRICLSIMSILKHGDPASLVPFVEQKCNNLTKNSAVCRDISSTFGSLLQLLQSYTEEEICSLVKLCEPSFTPAQALPTSKCYTCVITVETLKEIVARRDSNTIIQSVLEKLCSILPHSEKQICYNIVQGPGVDAIRIMIEHIVPTEFCARFGLCTERNSNAVTTTAVPASAETTEASNRSKVPCKFCMMAVKMLLDQLGDEKTEESIRKALDGLCSYFPEETRDTCKNLINEYSEDLIDMILADFNASEICNFLKLCHDQHLFGADGHDKRLPTFDVETNEVRDWVEGMEMTHEKENKTSSVDRRVEVAFSEFRKVVQECALCEALVGVISNHKRMWVRNYDFSANAARICSIVPSDKRQMCTTMLISYGPSIANLLRDHEIDPNKICVVLDLCDENMQAKVNQPVSVPEPKHNIGDKNECLQGPAFWCANAENAEKCGTFLHCQETAWKSWKSPPKRPNNNL